MLRIQTLNAFVDPLSQHAFYLILAIERIVASPVKNELIKFVHVRRLCSRYLMHPRQRQQNARQYDIAERDGQNAFPAEAHELVVAETGQRPTDPDEENDERTHL